MGARRCFICLTDEEPSDNPSDWVDPCPCTLEAHQDCMLSWVTDCERSSKPLVCPVCKSPIKLEAPWDPIVALHDSCQRAFTRASPLLLAGGVSMGIHFSLQMYGAIALYTFAGPKAFREFFIPASPLAGRGQVIATRVLRSLQLTSVGPVLLLSQLLPGLSDKILLPIASMYSIYHAGHGDLMYQWSPTPQAAIAVFPFIRSVYYKLWREFVYPYESNLNRQLNGLPPLEPAAANVNGNNVGAGHRHAEGGLLGFLHGIADALEADVEGGDDEAAGIHVVRDEVRAERDENGDDEVVLELVIEGVIGGDGDEDWEAPGPVQEPEVQREAQPAPPAANRPDPQGDARPRAAGAEEQQQPAAENDRHEAPIAPPARRPGIGIVLSNMSNALVGSLMLPVTCFLAGELLGLMLPTSWTRSPRRTGWGWAGNMGRPGLLQQQWGRSLVGGCLYAVMRDAVRLYAKRRKVASMGIRRVKNVERRRNRR
ncbi:hypothetical protein B0I35DRAFT_452919 [Stachybotrys elegans]|uniref:RING-CH-type domain-containing protein n=1 Tax=Stachybotrys elegans TaxID=80388 RepID=A0A8K0WNE7_9HYPO|nr:hypothetical protein B0I35DRAFT_452919 [Stachybotrys elegans]